MRGEDRIPNILDPVIEKARIVSCVFYFAQHRSLKSLQELLSEVEPKLDKNSSRIVLESPGS